MRYTFTSDCINQMRWLLLYYNDFLGLNLSNLRNQFRIKMLTSILSILCSFFWMKIKMADWTLKNSHHFWLSGDYHELLCKLQRLVLPSWILNCRREIKCKIYLPMMILHNFFVVYLSVIKIVIGVEQWLIHDVLRRNLS